jgi:hypothetical protein
LRVRRRLPGALHRFAQHVSARDAYADVVVRTLPKPFSSVLYGDVGNSWLYTTEAHILFGAIAPSWHGAKSVARDDDVAQLISDFAHLGSQYVLRSRIVGAQFALSAVYQVACDFRRAGMMRYTEQVGDLKRAQLLIEENYPKPNANRKSRNRQLESWMKVANCLDPHIHRAVYQFWRAVALHDAGFFEDSFSSLDGVVAVGAEALHLWLGLKEQPTRIDAAKELNLSAEDQKLAGQLYALRCGFGAHPPVSKWWDFYELYEGHVEVFFDFVGRFLKQLCALECRYRRVDPSPPMWGQWFSNHADMLLDVVWFTKLPNPPR